MCKEVLTSEFMVNPPVPVANQAIDPNYAIPTVSLLLSIHRTFSCVEYEFEKLCPVLAKTVWEKEWTMPVLVRNRV